VTQKAFSRVRQPSKLVLVSELSGALGLSAHDHKQSRQSNNAKNVVAFVDGHVSYLPIYWNGDSGMENIPCHYNPPPGYEYAWFDK
jgi:prepilin-type processing-associated H-X9-DG protein